MDFGELAPMLEPRGRRGRPLRRRLGCPAADGGQSPLFPLWLLKHLPNMLAAHISMAFGCQGPNNTVVTACVAGTQAVGEGFRG